MDDKTRSIKNKTLRYLGIALIVIGIVIIVYPFYTNFVMKRREADVMNSWENQISFDTTMQATTQATTTDTLTGNDTQVTDQSGNTSQSQTTQSGDQSQSSETTLGGQTAQSQQVIPGATFKITIPKINSSWVGYEGTNIPSLKRGPGHYIGTPKPGELGTCVIAGHRTTYGAPFNRVDQLVNGDQIIIETPDGKQFIYLVTGEMEVLPKDLSALKQTEYASLILTTCTPKYYATRRLLVFAKLAE
ncbi:MAG: class E sortase [Actinobacteria bacterium]|nr:class E sortase [Actinomycetota bacterium]